MNELQILNISGIDCYEKNGTAYLKLDSVARGLGFTQEKNGVEYVKWERVFGHLKEIGFSPLLGKDAFIPENVFYRLAMKAKNEVAEKFQAKIADEVIPSIRKTGGYIAATTDMTDAEIMARALVVANDTIKRRDERIKALETQVETERPKVLFADSVSASKHSILIGEMAKILKQNGVDNMGQNRFFEWLRQNGYLIRRMGTDYNMPTQKSMELGLLEIKETAITHPDGHTTVSKTPKVTGKGQQYFINKFLAAD